MSKESPKSITKGYKCLVFDTETTGLRDERKVIFNPEWNNNKQKTKWLDNPDFGHIPHILQLSYILYDSKDPENPTIYNKYIDDILSDDSITITDKAKGIHNIDKELIQRCYDFHTDKFSMEEESEEETKKLLETVSMEGALEEFFNDIEGVQYIVGHNVQFDIDRLQEEIDRLKDEKKKTKYKKIIEEWSERVECTLTANVNTCELPKTDKQIDRDVKELKKNANYKPKYLYKSPTLSETYEHYFGYEPKKEGLHDAIMDVVLTLRVFLYSVFEVDVCSKNKTIHDYIKKITPDGYTDVCAIPSSGEKAGGKRRKSKKRSKSRGGKRRKSKQTKKRRKKKSL
tara:strand:- start:16865 stop:17893 length:1029 start_codon:yes stop_codon:yes gene_type:complete